MKTPATSRILTRSIAVLLAAAAVQQTKAQTNGTWTNTAGGSWPTTTNWSGGTVANGIGAIADFSTLNITANATVTLDGARTIGTLRFQDATTASNDWILNTGSSGPLTMQVSSGVPQIEVLNRTVTIGAVLAGTQGINVSNGTSTVGGNTLILGSANTFSGGLSIQGAIVQLNNATSAGSNTITMTSGGTGQATRLVINAGVAINNNIVIGTGSTVNNIAGRGIIERAGTGNGTINGTITINNSASAGGIFVGGANANNVLILNGAINSSVPVNQRDGFVRYGGGGSYTSMIVTNTAQVGANDGIATSAVVTLGGSGTANLNLNGFNQTLAGLIFGAAGQAHVGNVVLGGQTLTLSGDLTVTAGTTPAHTMTATAGGTLALGSVNRTFSIADTTADDDLTITGAAITGSGGLTKTGAGTLVLRNVNMAGPLTITAGNLATGSATAVGTLNVGSLGFTGTNGLRMSIGTGGDLITSAGALTAGGTTTITLKQFGGALPLGNTPIINYTGTSPGTGGFALAPLPGRVVGTLVDTGSAIALNVTANDKVVWDGTNSTAWATGTTGNWKLLSNSSPADFLTDDDVIFADAPTTSNVSIATAVSPSNVTFTNTTATTYTVTGAAGIAGTTGLTKTGNGTVVLANANNTYAGATTVNAGTLELDHDATGNVVLSGTSGVSVAAGATLRLTRDDGAFTFSRNFSGTGTVEINPHSATGGTTAHGVTLSGTNTGHTGTLRLLSPVTGTYRINSLAPAQLGNGSIEVQNGAQVYTAANQTYNNAINIAGTGFADSAGNIGALRLESNSVWAGPVTVAVGGARIGAHNTTATVSGPITGGPLEVNATNFNNSYTLIFTGTNSYGTTVIGGQNTQTAGVPSMRLNIGAGGTTGTLGAGNVTIHGDGANGVLGFDRSDGYTLAPGQTITGSNGLGTITNSIQRTFIDFDTTGAGFSDNGNSITLGSPAIGGTLRFGQGRANTVTSLSGTTTAQVARVAAAQNNATLNLLSGVLFNANYLTAGEAANMSGIININPGATVNIIGQVRAGHFGTETSTINMLGGTLTLTGASPNLTPSTGASGGAGATGDNNINADPVANIHGGGIYLGIDGTGIFNHTGGTVTTNWIVLDNRGDTGIGANMGDGIDRYNLSGAASVLNLRSTWGLIQRNATSAVSFGGGTVRVDNTGTGTGTGPNITIPLDATIDTVASTTTSLDTNGGGNGFTLNRNVRGAGTLSLSGGGNINFTTTGEQLISPNVTSGGTSANLVKLGTGTTSLLGSGLGFNGAITVSAGRLNAPANLTPSAVNVADGATLNSELLAINATLGSAAGSNFFFNPATPGAFTAASLTLNGTTTIDFSEAPLGAGPYTVLNYTTLSGAPTFALANAANYRSASINTSTPGIVTVDVTTKNLAWTGLGTVNNAWDQNTNQNWSDGISPETFFAGDSVTFGDGPAVVNINVSSGVSPFKTTVNSSTNNYTFTSAGNGISGVGNLEKTGDSILTLVNANTYAGKTVVGGGVLSYASATSLGNASSTNTIALSGGGRLRYSGTTALDLGTTRSIAVGTGGGIIAHSGTTNVTMTVPGQITGNAPLTFSTTGTSGTASTVTNYVLTGDNAGYTGDITLEATGNILSQLSIGTQLAVPNASSITVNFPVGSITANNANVLNLSGVTLPSLTALNLNSQVTSVNLRTQITTAGAVTINGPIKLTGNGGAIVQFNPAANSTLTVNGNISEGLSPFGTSGSLGVLFLRAAGNTVINGTINLPTALISRVDDSGITTINSTGNVWALTDVRSSSTLRIGANNALATMAPLRIGQATDAGNSIFDLNGFNQEIAGLDYLNGTGANSRRVTNTATAFSTLTINNSTDFTFGSVATNGAGNLTGNLHIVKNGSGSQTFAGPANTYTGNVTINGGTLVAGGNATSNALGNPTVAGRTVTVNNSGTVLSFTTNNVLGSGVGNANLPSITLNSGTTLTSTRYNVLGPITLNGATLTQSSTDSGSFEGFQFKGAVTVGGSAASTISTGNSKANHLDSNTLFTVANATGDAAADLLISAPLRNQSNDFGLAAGGLTKAGNGTMEISSTSTYTGATTVNAGTLLISGSIAGSTVNVNGGVLGGTGTTGPINVTTGMIAPGASIGTLNASGNVSLASGSTFSLEINSNPTIVTDLLAATGSVTLSLATLSAVDLGSQTLNSGETFTFITATGGVTGNFAGLPDGATLFVGASLYEIDYAANSVSLIAVPEPGALAALLGGMGVLAGLRRFRRR